MTKVEAYTRNTLYGVNWIGNHVQSNVKVCAGLEWLEKKETVYWKSRDLVQREFYSFLTRQSRTGRCSRTART